MKTNELRIGNYVLSRSGKILCIDYWEAPGKIAQNVVIEGMTMHPLTERCDYLQPIPLTEEWLINLGFEYHNNKSEYFNEQVFIKHVEDNGNIKTITVKILSSGYQIVTKYEVLLTNEYRWGEQLVGRVYWKDDLHVHTLQNLYFALTGEELTLKK